MITQIEQYESILTNPTGWSPIFIGTDDESVSPSTSESTAFNLTFDPAAAAAAIVFVWDNTTTPVSADWSPSIDLEAADVGESSAAPFIVNEDTTTPFTVNDTTSTALAANAPSSFLQTQTQTETETQTKSQSQSKLRGITNIVLNEFVNVRTYQPASGDDVAVFAREALRVLLNGALASDLPYDPLPCGMVGPRTNLRREGIREVLLGYMQGRPLNVAGDEIAEVRADARMRQVSEWVECLFLAFRPGVPPRPPAPAPPTVSVLVSGGGPVGLSAAITAKRTRWTNRVTLMERLTSSRRQYLFDWSSAAARFTHQTLGLGMLDPMFANPRKSLPVHVVERFLAKVAWTAGIEMNFGRLVLGSCAVQGPAAGPPGAVVQTPSMVVSINSNTNPRPPASRLPYPTGAALRRLCTGLDRRFEFQLPDNRGQMVNYRYDADRAEFDLVVGCEGNKSPTRVSLALGARDLPRSQVVSLFKQPAAAAGTGQLLSVPGLEAFQIKFHLLPVEVAGRVTCPFDIIDIAATHAELLRVVFNTWIPDNRDDWFCTYTLVIKSVNKGQYVVGDNVNMGRVVDALHGPNTRMTANWPNCGRLVGDQRIVCFTRMFDPRGLNPEPFSQLTGMAPSFASDRGYILGDAARRSFNMLGVGVNQGIRQATEFFGTAVSSRLAGNNPTATMNVVMERSSGHLTDLSQQWMVVQNYCPGMNLPEMDIPLLLSFDYSDPIRETIKNIYGGCDGLANTPNRPNLIMLTIATRNEVHYDNPMGEPFYRSTTAFSDANALGFCAAALGNLQPIGLVRDDVNGRFVAPTRAQIQAIWDRIEGCTMLEGQFIAAARARFP